MKHIVKITRPPELSGKQSTPDGAVCGGGDLGVILGNAENGLRIYLSKCDLWEGIEAHDRGGLKPLGHIDVPVPAELYNNYYVEQDMDLGELRCRFAEGERLVTVNVRANKTENSVMLELGGTEEAVPTLCLPEGEIAGKYGELTREGIPGIFRSFAGADYAYETHGFAFMKNVGGGRYYLFAATNHDVNDPEAAAFRKVSGMTEEAYDGLLKAHYEAWESFREASAFTCADEELENCWYASQYLIEGCTGNREFPPGLYANFITVENPSWHSDYHLNYNYQAPFYAACSSNHVGMTDCYHAPLEAFLDRGREFAEKWGAKGIVYPVGLGPKAVCTEWTPQNKYAFERLFLGQKSNAIHPADIMVFRWNATKDREYARLHAYPYLKEAIEFYLSWAKLENGQYVIPADAAHEVPLYRDDFTPGKYKKTLNDTNNALTLGLLRMCIPAAIEMAQTLGIDEEKTVQWQEFLDKLSPFPECIRHFRRVFRYTKKGMRWNEGNDVGQQHIYPAGCIGTLNTDRRTLKIARNTFRQKKECWTDGNAVCSYYPMAARLGIDPAEILAHLREVNETYRLPNMLYSFAGGCLETCPFTAATLNEMVLQSFEGTLRLFPCWDGTVDVSFRSLRADGAFLVSSEMKGGRMTFAEIVSEAGQPLKISNPYEKTVVRTDTGSFETSDRTISLQTVPGERIRLTEADGKQ